MRRLPRALLGLALTISLLSCLGLGCGAQDQTKPKAAVATNATPAAPRCAPETDNQPSDAKARMNGLQASIRQCFALGTSGSKGVSVVKISLDIAESGAVKKAKVIDAEGAQPNAIECCEKAARGATFSKFCGDDANIRWTYTLE